MFDLFMKLSTSDKIQIISIIATTLISVVSVIIAVATLRQTNKITEEANRPYVVIYLEVIQVTSSFTYYLVIKNFGASGAIIDSVSYFPDFQNKFKNKPFSKLENHFIAPNQSLSTACCFQKPYIPITFVINYHQGKKFYTESFIINPEATSSILITKSAPSNSSNLEKIIAHSAQELIRTNL